MSKRKFITQFFQLYEYFNRLSKFLKKNKIKFFKSLLTIFQYFDPDIVFGDGILQSKVTKQDILKIFKNIVKDGHQLSQIEANDQYFKESNIHSTVLDILTYFIKFEHKFKNELLQSLLGILKNCAGIE